MPDRLLSPDCHSEALDEDTDEMVPCTLGCHSWTEAGWQREKTIMQGDE